MAFADKAGIVAITNSLLLSRSELEDGFKLGDSSSLAGLPSLNFDEITLRKT